MHVFVASLFFLSLSLVSCTDSHIASKREGLIPHRTKPLTDFSMEVSAPMQAEEARSEDIL